MRTVRSGLVALLVVAALALAGCGSGGSTNSNGLTTVKVAYTPIYTIGALKLGIDQGFFKDEGLQLQLQQVANPPAGIAAVAGGQVDVNYSPTIPIFAASASGVGLKIIAPADGNDPAGVKKVAADPSVGPKYDDSAVVVGKDSGITSAKDLEGKKVAVPARGAQLEVTIAAAVKDAGGDPSKIQWITLDFPTAVSALESGRVDAAGLVSPFVNQAVTGGGQLLQSLSLGFFGPGAVGMWVTSAKEAGSKASTMSAFARAVDKSNAYASTHVAEAQEAAAKLLKVDLKTVQGGATPYFPTSIDTASLQRTVDQMRTLGYLKTNVDASSLILSGK